MSQVLSLLASRLTGDWGRFKKFANNFGKDMKSSAKDLQKKQATMIKEDIIEGVTSQSRGLKPLAKATVETKGHGTILVDTSEMINSFEIQNHGDTAIISPQGTHKSGLTNEELATIHEYGTNKIPPRPFVRPVYDEYKDKVPKEYLDLIEKEISKY